MSGQGEAKRFEGVEQAVEEILSRVGRRLVVATPLGLGKANHLANEIYRRAVEDPGIELRIVTALTLARPRAKTELERRLAGPIVERLFGDYPELAWVDPLRRDELPPNVDITSFYFQPGAYLASERAQQAYISANYTHVVRDLLDDCVNVLVQAVAAEGEPGADDERFSFASNPDLTLDLIPRMRHREACGRPVVVAAQVNRNLPFMDGPAAVSPSTFDLVLDHPRYAFDLFGPPNLPIGTAEYAIALHASALVQDGGTLQLGIGALGDAITHMLQLRHRGDGTFEELLEAVGAMGPSGRSSGVIETVGGTGPFAKGLFGSSEMLVSGFLELLASGILTRRVYDHLGLQRALDAGAIGETLGPDTLEILVERGDLPAWLGPDETATLRELGLLRPEVRWEAGNLTNDRGEPVPAHLADPEACREIARRFLGERLEGGAVAHAGFFLGPHAFYRALREMPPERRREIVMTRISWVNELYGDEELKRVQRKNARFLNTGLFATLLGAVASDGFEDGRVLSGVGGQYNFVTMAQELEDGRSVLMVRSVRETGDGATSNIRWSYGHTTIPRHLRDILVTEYGIADLRGKTDEEVIAATLRVTDSRFQDELLARAREAGKLPRSFVLEERYRENRPERLEAALRPFRDRGLLPELPFGSDLTDVERTLQKALNGLKERVESGFPAVLPRPRDLATLLASPPEAARPYLERMELDRPRNVKERLLRRAVVWALREAGAA